MRKALPFIIIVSLALLWGACSLRGGGRGVTWDEPFYLYGGGIYLGLHETPEGTGSRWRTNHEHPPLAKIAIGVGEVVGILIARDATGMVAGGRFAVVLFFALLLVGVYRLAEPLGRGVGALSVLFCFSCPRLLGHAELATLDLPLVALWVWSLWAFMKLTDGDKAFPKGRVVAAGVIFGLAMLTKFTAVMLPVVLVAWITLGRLYRDKGRPVAGGLVSAALIAIGGLAMLVLFWPWLWSDTVPRLVSYFSKSLTHKMAPLLYLGKVYGQTNGLDVPPWHYAPVMLLVTTPLLVLLGLALCFILEGRGLLRKPLLSLILLGALALPAATLMPGGIAYDGVRLFLPTLPLFCILSAHGICSLLARIFAKGGEVGELSVHMYVALALGAALALFNNFAVSDNLSYFNPAVGGPAGAEKLGFEVAYWGTALTQDNTPPVVRSAMRVRLVGFGAFAPPIMSDLGVLHEDVNIVSDGSWEVAVVVHRKSLVGYGEFMAQLEKGKYSSREIYCRSWPFAPAVSITVYEKKPAP
ncbi:MAG: glycosyltransferase family 39 protein [Planctomycetes bacterium]|nr:glycosyltransferase family 39 protein [Planctomycetota bacterium]